MTGDQSYLVHIRDAVRDVTEFAAEGRAVFLQDRKTQAAIVRNLEIIGEAVKHLSSALRDANPNDLGKGSRECAIS